VNQIKQNDIGQHNYTNATADILHRNVYRVSSCQSSTVLTTNTTCMSSAVLITVTKLYIGTAKQYF